MRYQRGATWILAASVLLSLPSCKKECPDGSIVGSSDTCPTPPPPTTTTPPPPPPASAVTGQPGIDGEFACGGSMTCGSGRVLTGLRDGTGCGIANRGFCSTVQVLDQRGNLFSGVRTANCVPLPAFGCGQAAECSGGKVLVGYSDGTGCGILNGGQCCDLVTLSGNVPLTTTSCSSQSDFTCGNTSQCAPGQAMVGMQDGTGCGVPNKIRCCNLIVK